MVYLLNENDRPDYSDTIVLTVASTANPDVTIAGAKYSVSKARFPFQFIMNRANIIDKQYANMDIIDSDLLVTARICPTTNPTTSVRINDLKDATSGSVTTEKKTSRIYQR